MRQISIEEVQGVRGGMGLVGIIITVIAGGAYLGKAMAERDNRLSAAAKCECDK